MNQVINAILDNTDGRFVGVTFIKKNGEVRDMNAVISRSGLHDKHITAFDVQKGAYRNINRESILEVRAGNCIVVNRKV